MTQQLDAAAPSPPPSPAHTTDPNVVLGAIRDRDSEAAVASINGYSGPEDRLHVALAQAVAEDNSVAPIMVAHTVKTTRAAIVDSERLGSRAPLAAVGRFLGSPKRERFVYRSTLEALDFVAGRSKGEGE